MKLYGSTFSPYVRKVLAFAHEKGIEMDVQAVGIGDASPEFRAASPFGKMPALKDGEYLLSDSSAIVQYLEAKQPQPALIPTEAEDRGRVIWFEEFADTILMSCLQKMFFNRVVSPVFLRRDGDARVADKAEREELPPLLAYLEKVIPEQGYLIGSKVTLADLAVASPLANLAHMGCAVDREVNPRTAAFLDRILERPSFAPLIARELKYLRKTGALAA